MAASSEENLVKYEAADRPPHRLAAALGAQVVALIVAGIVLTPVVVLRAAEAPQSVAAWVIFMALLVSGLVTIIQAAPVWRIGAGYVLFMGTSGAFISVSVSAIQAGGMPLLMTMIVAASLIQFPMASRLGMLRKIITPTVGGTAIMLIGVTVMPIAFGMLSRVPEDSSSNLAGPACSATTLVVVLAISIFAASRWRLWAPLVGLIAGTAVGSAFGIVEIEGITAAPWIGLPEWAWPGLDLSFDQSFWALLPAFVIVTLVGAIETFGDGIAIQRVSWRDRRATDYRAVQGAVYADGLGNLLSGLGGTLPNTTYSTSVAVVDITGVAARRVGIWGGGFLIALAFSPKLAAVLLAVPSPVAGAYIIILIALLFMHGMSLVFDGGLTYEKTVIAGLGFWLGVGFQNKAIYYDLLPDWAAALLSNGMTSGTVAAVLLTVLFGLKRGRPRRLLIPLAASAVPRVRDFVLESARQTGWDRAASDRLELAAEEAIIVMLGEAEDGKERTLRVDVSVEQGVIELDIVVALAGANIEDQLAVFDDSTDDIEAGLGYRILAAMVDELRHQQYHGVDFLTLRLSGSPH